MPIGILLLACPMDILIICLQENMAVFIPVELVKKENMVSKNIAILDSLQMTGIPSHQLIIDVWKIN